MQIEVGYITIELFKMFIERFFPEVNESLFNKELKEKDLTGAELQNDILAGLSVDEIIEKRTKGV